MHFSPPHKRICTRKFTVAALNAILKSTLSGNFDHFQNRFLMIHRACRRGFLYFRENYPLPRKIRLVNSENLADAKFFSKFSIFRSS